MEEILERRIWKIIFHVRHGNKTYIRVTRSYQTKFDGFFPFWLGLGMGMGFPRFQNTGMGRVMGI